MNPYARVKHAKFKRELEEDWIDLHALAAQRRAFLARVEAEEEVIRKRLNAKLALIGQSLDQLIAAA